MRWRYFGLRVSRQLRPLLIITVVVTTGTATTAIIIGITTTTIIIATGRGLWAVTGTAIGKAPARANEPEGRHRPRHAPVRNDDDVAGA